MIQCWSSDPTERPTFDEIINILIKKDDKSKKYLLHGVDDDEISFYLKEIDDSDDVLDNFLNKTKIIEEVNMTYYYYDDEKMIINKKRECSEYLFFMEMGI